MSDQDVPKIYRFTLPVLDGQVLSIHAGAQILSVAPTRDGSSDRIDLWASTYPNDLPRSGRWIHIAGTGHPLPTGRFIGTVVTPAGLVWHVFEGGPA